MISILTGSNRERNFKIDEQEWEEAGRSTNVWNVWWQRQKNGKKKKWTLFLKIPHSADIIMMMWIF